MERGMSHVLLLDIDGVLNEPQQPISDEMRAKITWASFRMPIYFVTGNGYTKGIDMLGWHGFAGIFCNNGDELRGSDGHCIWRDEVTPPLPQMDLIYRANNSIEWRSPRFVNYCPIGRYATPEQRAEHTDNWRASFMDSIASAFPGVDCAAGGAVSVDVYSRGADKSRAARYLNEQGYGFLFIGDKTEPGGNDYCIRQYCENNEGNKNKVFTSNGTTNTIELLDKILSGDNKTEEFVEPRDIKTQEAS